MVPLIILLLVLVLVVFPLWAIIRIHSLARRNESLEQRLLELQWEFRSWRDKAPAPTPATVPMPSAAPKAAPPSAPPLQVPPPIVVPRPAAPPPITTAPEPPVVTTVLPPPILPAEPQPALPEPTPLRARINWEHFMGAKLFAWLGGAAALLGVVFFVKYSFEHDLIPPEVRVALGFLFAVGILVAGLKINRERYAVTAQTLCATGIVSLYAVTFACNSVYHFAFFGPLATFLLMTLITGVAFLLAVRLEARVVAVLGMLGGFLTPVLLSTGRDNPPGLFGYIALLNLGLIAVALHRRWPVLVALGAAATAIMQVGWADKFLTPAKGTTAMVVCLAFCALFLAAYAVARRLGRETTTFLWCAIAFPFVAFGFAAVLMSYAAVATRPGALFGFVLLADACLLALAWLDENAPKLHLIGGAAVFALLAAWTGLRLTNELLPWALAFYLLYAVLHTAFPLLLERHRPDAGPTWWSQLFPPLALGLMFLPLLKLDAVSLLFWPCVFLLDLLAIGLALLTASLAAVAAVLILTLAVAAVWMFNVPAGIASEPAALLVVGGFAVLFFAAGLFLALRCAEKFPTPGAPSPGWLGDARAQIPAFSALLPFLLLIMMTQRLPLANPSPLFGLALLLNALTCGLTVLLARWSEAQVGQSSPGSPAMDAVEEPSLSDSEKVARALRARAGGARSAPPTTTVAWLPACALAGTSALEMAWAARHRVVPDAIVPLAWFLGFHATFALFPFVFRRRFAGTTGPWAVAALSGVAAFPLVYRLVQQAWPNDLMGLLPAAFAGPPLVSLMMILRSPGATVAGARLNQLAWFGGVALLFITLIFPIQFDRQWLTLGWALEGTALLWLYHRVPHRGLRLTGVALLIGAFARLAANPAVLAYHTRSDTALFNWYLYSYGVVTLCLFAGSRLLARPDPVDASESDRVFGINAPALFNAFGVVLAFLLLNIEIADYFTPAGSRVLTFQFSGNFARDMTYTIAWALFALGLLLVSIWMTTAAGRYAALGLLGAALLKLFFHDLARLEALYRIGALFGVAVIAIVASFAYQRFLPGNEKASSE